MPSGNLSAMSAASKPSASQTYAALTRQQWADYVSTYVPLENKMIEFATDRTQPAKAMAAASENVSDAFAMQEGDFQRRLQGLGTTLTADEQAAQTRAAGLSKSLADVQAQNIAGTQTRELQYGLMGAASPNVAAKAAQAGA